MVPAAGLQLLAGAVTCGPSTEVVAGAEPRALQLWLGEGLQVCPDATAALPVHQCWRPTRGLVTLPQRHHVSISVHTVNIFDPR